VITHDGKVGATGNAHTHDGGDLRNAHGGHDCVVAKDTTEVVSIGENVLLERQKNAGRIDQINRGNAVFDRHILRANDFFRGHGEERAGFHRSVVGDQHNHSTTDSRESSNRSSGRSATPFFVHFESGECTQFEKVRAGIDEFGDTFAGGEAAFLVLGFDSFRAAALADEFVLILDLGEEVDDAAGVLLKVRGIAIDGRFQTRSGHAAPSLEQLTQYKRLEDEEAKFRGNEVITKSADEETKRQRAFFE